MTVDYRRVLHYFFILFMFYFILFYWITSTSDGSSYLCSHIIRLTCSSDVLDNILIMKLVSFFILC